MRSVSSNPSQLPRKIEEGEECRVQGGARGIVVQQGAKEGEEDSGDWAQLEEVPGRDGRRRGAEGGGQRRGKVWDATSTCWERVEEGRSWRRRRRSRRRFEKEEGDELGSCFREVESRREGGGERRWTQGGIDPGWGASLVWLREEEEGCKEAGENREWRVERGRRRGKWWKVR